MSKTRTIVPAETREGEFAVGGTGGFSPYESWQRLRTSEDERLDAEAKKLYRRGIQEHNFRPFNEFLAGLKAKGVPQKYRDRLVAMAGCGIKVRG